jgi:hypothetical protein
VAVVCLSSLLSGDAEGLAGEASAHNVNGTEPTQSVCVNAVDVVEARDRGPMLSEHGSAVFVALTERDGSHPRALESEAKAPDAGKKVEDAHVTRPPSRRLLT